MQPITSWFQHLTSLVNSVIASLHKSAPIIFPPVTSHKVRKFFMHHPSCFKPKRSSMLIPMRWNLKTQAKWPMVWLKPTLVDQSGLFESQCPVQICQAMIKPYPILLFHQVRESLWIPIYIRLQSWTKSRNASISLWPPLEVPPHIFTSWQGTVKISYNGTLRSYSGTNLNEVIIMLVAKHIEEHHILS